MSSKKGKANTKAIPKSSKKGSARTERNSEADEDDIFMDKGELLREKLDKMDANIATVSKEIENLKAYSNWLELALEERALQNNELVNFVQKKELQKLNHSTTLGDFHRYNIEVLEKERKQMLQEFASKKEVLRVQLNKEQETLDRYQEELSKMDELRSVKLKQETEIDQLEKQARLLRTQCSQKINQLKEELQKSEEQLECEGQRHLKQITTDAQRESLQLVIEKVQDTQHENYELREDIWKTRQNIQLLERHLDQLMAQYNEFRRETLQATDLDYVRNKRLEGLQQLGQ